MLTLYMLLFLLLCVMPFSIDLHVKCIAVNENVNVLFILQTKG